MRFPPKRHKETSIFQPENLLREARRQRSIPNKPVPSVCLLDPDGDIVRWLIANGAASKSPHWACYHTDLYVCRVDGLRFGVVAYAVGAPFAVLVAEELFASGCKLLVSITSSGQLYPVRKPTYFVLIDKALRDEGTSRNYLPLSEYSRLDVKLVRLLKGAFRNSAVPVEVGAVWTTDAPFRETATAVEYCRRKGLIAVEMEAAALYAFAKAKGKPVICFAHVTNQMANIEGDFEKGADNGSQDALWVFERVTKLWRSSERQAFSK